MEYCDFKCVFCGIFLICCKGFFVLRRRVLSGGLIQKCTRTPTLISRNEYSPFGFIMKH